MHRMHNNPSTNTGPETTGATIHWASEYDILTRVFGLGVNRPNSKMIVEMAKIKPGESVLDVGCGTGNLTQTAKGYAGSSGSVYGIDASPEMIEIARKKALRAGADITFDLCPIEQIAYPEATFDVVISRLVIHHLPDDLKRQGFLQLFRVLKPGGRIFLADFNPPTNPVLAHLTMALVGHGMMHASLSGIPNMLAEAGFIEITTGPTRSVFLGSVSGIKPFL